MARASAAITGWPAVILGLLLAPVALIAAPFMRRTIDRSAGEVAHFLRDFLEGTGGDWDWDEFESVPITDPRLEAIRKAAVMAGPPEPDIPRLKALLAEAERLALP